MTTTYHTAIAAGAAANASVFNAPLGQLDAHLDDAMTFAVNNNAELTAARSPYASLDARLDAITFGYVGGNIATLTNGAANAGQKDVTVDSTVGFLVGAYVAYELVGGAVEYNTIASITPTTVLVMTTNIGTGGIADNSYIGMISVSEYQAANVIPHGDPLTLPETVEYTNNGVYNVRAYGASPAASGAINSAAFQLAIDDAEAAGHGIVTCPPGAYTLATGLTLQSANVHVSGYGAVLTCASGEDFLTLTGLIYSGSVRGVDVRVSGGGSGFILDSGYLSSFEFRDCSVYVTSGAGSCYLQPGGSSAANICISNCNFDMAVDATGPAISVVDTTGGSFNNCVIKRCWLQMNKNDNTPAISLSSHLSNYLYAVALRDLVFEQSHGGAILLQGVYGAIIENCWVYDLDAAILTTADMFEISKHADGLASKGTLMANCGVIGNYTPGAFYGIDLTNGGLGTTLINCNATDTVEFNINAAGQAIVYINCNLPILNAGDWELGINPSEYVAKLAIKTDTGDPTAREGMLYVNKYDNKLRLYIDGAWKDVLAW